MNEGRPTGALRGMPARQPRRRSRRSSSSAGGLSTASRKALPGLKFGTSFSDEVRAAVLD
mgnify:CR=1 FL=1